MSERQYRASFNRERLKSLRKARGLSRDRLGALAKVQTKTLYNIETCGREPRSGTVDALAVALGVEREYFYRED